MNLSFVRLPQPYSGILWEICVEQDVAKAVIKCGAVPALLHVCSRNLAAAGSKSEFPHLTIPSDAGFPIRLLSRMTLAIYMIGLSTCVQSQRKLRRKMARRKRVATLLPLPTWQMLLFVMPREHCTTSRSWTRQR